jgi:hypothetical protein
LLEPRAEIEDCRRGDNRDFVAATFRGGAQDGAKHDTGVRLGGNAGAARVDHFFGALQESRHIQTHERAGHHAEIRKRRIAPADAGHSVEDAAEAIGFRDFLHLGAGIGDRDEVAASFLRAHHLLGPLEKVLLENVGLERRAGLARDYEQSFRRVYLAIESLNLCGIGGVEYMKLWEARDAAEGLCQHLGAEARSSHAE